jgi:tetratricopeptide (TPR) repeat protein
MKSRRWVLLLAVLLLAAAAVGMAVYRSGRRPVTTSSKAAYEAYRDAIENEARFYAKEARVGFAKAIALDPNFAMALLGLARTSGDRDQALSLVERAVRLKPRLNELERMQVDMARAGFEGKREEMSRIAETIHAKYPDDIRATQTIAMRLLGEGKTDQALQIFADLLATEPNNATAYNQIGYYFAFRGDYDKAIENLKKYQFMAPDQANPWDSLGEIQAYSGRYDEAIQNLRKALAIKRDFYESWSHLGVAYEGKGEYAKAIECYEHAAADAAVDEQRIGFLLSAFRVAAEERDLKLARELTARILALPRTKSMELNGPFLEAALALLDGRPAEAERRLNELRPKLAEYRKKSGSAAGTVYEPGWNWLMARAKAALGKNDDAIALYREMVSPPTQWSSFPERRWVYEGRARLAELLAANGDLDGAEKLLDQNRKWNPSWAPTRACEQAVAQRRREKVLAAAR